MCEIGYSVTFDCDENFGWEEYWCNPTDVNSYKEMIEDIKYAARERKCNNVYIYNSDDELIESLKVYNRSAAIYKINEKVSFLLDGKEYIGTIAIVDEFGTFFDNSQPYYDIYITLQNEKTLVKHIQQSCIRKI